MHASDATNRAVVGPPRPGRGELAALGAIVALGVALRVAYVLALRAHPAFDAPTMDAGFHWAWALALAEGREFLDGPFFRAPLYPLWLAGWASIVGDATTLVPRLAQSALGGVTILATWLVGRRVAYTALGPEGAWRGAALLGAGLAAASTMLVAFDGELLIPTLIVPLATLALWRFVVAGESPTTRNALLAGLALGVAALARPNVLLCGATLLAPWLAQRRWRAVSALLLATLAPLLPATLHNAHEGDPTLVATQGGVNLWIGNNPASDGATAIVPGTRGGWWEGYHDSVRLAEAAEGRELKPSEVSAHYVGRVLDHVRSEPAQAASHLAWKTRLFFNARELGNNTEPTFTVERFAPWFADTLVRFGWLLALGLPGLFLAARRSSVGRVTAAFALLYAVGVIAFFVNARFRLPVVPPLAIGAAVAGVTLARGRSGRLALAAAVGALAVLVHLPLPHQRPPGVTGRMDLAKAELERGNVLAARALLEEALALDPDHPLVRVALADALRRSGDASRAVALLEDALTPGAPPEIEEHYVDALTDDGQARRAVLVADHALGSSGDRPGMLFARARARGALGDADGARRDLKRVLELEPTAAHAALALAELEAQLGNAGEALRWARRVLSMEAWAPRVALQRAQQLVRR